MNRSIDGKNQRTVNPGLRRVVCIGRKCFVCTLSGLILAGSLGGNAAKATSDLQGVSGQGEGESITVWFDDTCRLSGFSISAGYHKTASLYEKNSRPKEIELTFSDGSSCRVTLEDRMAQQTVTLSAPVDTASLTIRLVSVYPGTTYTDTAISEIVPF